MYHPETLNSKRVLLSIKKPSIQIQLISVIIHYHYYIIIIVIITKNYILY